MTEQLRFTEEDAEYLYNILQQSSAQTVEAVAVQVEIPVLTIEELDLEALTSALHGVTSPISQLKDWLYNVLKQFASWIADTVKTIIEDLFNTILAPILDGIKSTLEGVWGFLQQVPGTVEDFITWITNKANEIWNIIKTSIIDKIIDALGSVKDIISNIYDSLTNFLTKTLPAKIEETLSTIKNLATKTWSYIEQYLIDPLKNAIGSVGQTIENMVTTLRKFISEDLPKLPAAIENTIKEASKTLSQFINQHVIMPLKEISDNIKTVLNEAVGRIVEFATKTLPNAINTVLENIETIGQKVWNIIKENVVDKLVSAAKELIEYLKTIGSTLSRIITEDMPSYVREFIDKIKVSFEELGKLVKEVVWPTIENMLNNVKIVVTHLIDNVKSFITEELPSRIKEVGELLYELPKRVFENLKVAGLTIWEYITKLGEKIGEALTNVGKYLETVGKYLHMVGAHLMGFVNAVAQLPRRLAEVFKDWIENIINILSTVKDWIVDVLSIIKNVLTDAWGFVKEKILEPMWKGLVWYAEHLIGGLELIGGALIRGIKKLPGLIVSIASSMINLIFETFVFLGTKFKDLAINVFTNILIKPLSKLVGLYKQVWESILVSTADKGGGYGIGLMMDIAWNLLSEYWKSTLLVYIISKLPSAYADFEIVVEPEALGTKAGGLRYTIKLGELAEAFVQGLKDFYPSFLTGTFVGIGTTLMRPVEYLYRARFVADYEPIIPKMYKDVLKEEIEKGALISAFVETPGLTELREWIRRQLVLIGGISNKKELQKLIATLRAHLKLLGYPSWYIDFLSDTGERLNITFPDRFGKVRKLLLSTIFELPTHSELARMTQRDVLPGVDIMQQLGWLRGWPEDLTTIIYLMTFKYPSFEKLWKFYMRATAGMLWFKAPDIIQQVFSKEAEVIGAGKPISPLDLQKALRSPEQFRAFELAINTYFKWLEYSNFSWFTDKTTMYGIPIGSMIYSSLGGWTADSWIMADVAADIPGKIDLRWMSRYGIFMWMADKLTKAGVTFESYQPLVQAIPALLEQGPASNITVELQWMSKLLQATGLHPAWVPIVTVAENIMVISDEMTLLRTGWLNLFKEGMLTIDMVEKALSGIISVSYKVGYWDPDKKVWTTGWITLPVRWLPHERRLLELRMLMDRILDLYREFEKYVTSGVRTLAVSSEEALSLIGQAVELLKAHFTKLSAKITGKPLTITLDSEYEKLRIELLRIAQKIEVKEKLKYWWYRVSGWLLYRIAAGYVTPQDIDNLMDVVTKNVPLFPEEVEAYKRIAASVLGIVARENYPTPSQLATISEIVPIPDELVNKVLAERRIPGDFWTIWREYIKKKPLKDDFNKVLTAYYKAKKYGVEIPKDVESSVQYWMQYFNVTKDERELRSLAVTLDILVNESKQYLPTPSTLATLSEYLVLPEDIVVKTLEAKHVPREWQSIWITYIKVKPIKSDAKSLLSTYVKALRYGVVTTKEFEEFLTELQQYGFTPKEIELIQRKAALEVAIAESKEYIPTPTMLASMAEYVAIPDELVKKVFEKRHVPEEWQPIWYKYIKVRPISDDIRYLLNEYLRLKKYGVKLPREYEDKVKQILQLGGVSELELEIRRLAAALEAFKESIPTLGMLATMAEYVDVPLDYIRKVLEARRVEKTFAELWIRYVYARMISGEVSRVVAQYRRLYEYFTVPDKLTNRILDLMRQGGWTTDEIRLFQLELSLRKEYRILRTLIPTLRGFVGDARYIPEWQKLLDDLLKAYGIDAKKYKEQIEYYKKLIRNRMVWRQIAYYRSTVIRAYAYGVIDRATLIKKLEALKQYGLSDEEIALLVDAAELEKQRRQIMQQMYG